MSDRVKVDTHAGYCKQSQKTMSLLWAGFISRYYCSIKTFTQLILWAAFSEVSVSLSDTAPQSNAWSLRTAPLPLLLLLTLLLMTTTWLLYQSTTDWLLLSMGPGAITQRFKYCTQCNLMLRQWMTRRNAIYAKLLQTTDIALWLFSFLLLLYVFYLWNSRKNRVFSKLGPQWLRVWHAESQWFISCYFPLLPVV